MDPRAPHTRPLLTLAILGYEAAPFIQHHARHGWHGSTGDIRWPDVSTGPAQVTLDTLRTAARAMGYEVPDALEVQAGQLFFRQGTLEEVRLAGTSTGDGSAPIDWHTPMLPTVQANADGTLSLPPNDADRKYLAVLVQGNEADSASRVVVCRWELTGEVAAFTSRDVPSPSLPKQPPVPTAFPDDHGRLPNNPLIAAGMAAIWKGGPKTRMLLGGWQDTDVGRPVYQHMGKHGGRILVYPNPGQRAADPLPTPATLWSLVERFNPFTADVALAVLAQLCEPSVGRRPQAPLLESVRITADAILHYKGIQRWGLERRLLHERIFEEMECLQSLQFDVEKYPERNLDTGKWDPTGVSWQSDRFFDIVKVELYQESLFGDHERIEVSWLVRAGQWARWWLNAQERVWIGHMAQVLLEFDHRETRGGAVMAKKIGQRMVLLSEALRIDEPITRRMDHLLEDIGELPAPKQRSKNWVGRIRKRAEAGLHALQDANVLIIEWPEEYSSIPNRVWLDTKLRFTLPEHPPPLPRPIVQPTSARGTQRRRRSRRTTVPRTPRVDGAMIRQTRQERYWSQKTLATHLGVTRPYLSQIENGTRLPSKTLAVKIQSWLRERQEA